MCVCVCVCVCVCCCCCIALARHGDVHATAQRVHVGGDGGGQMSAWHSSTCTIQSVHHGIVVTGLTCKVRVLMRGARQRF
jgi:hypothetical protein